MSKWLEHWPAYQKLWAWCLVLGVVVSLSKKLYTHIAPVYQLLNEALVSRYQLGKQPTEL